MLCKDTKILRKMQIFFNIFFCNLSNRYSARDMEIVVSRHDDVRLTLEGTGCSLSYRVVEHWLVSIEIAHGAH